MRKSQTFEVKSKQLHSFLHLALMAANPQSTQGTTYVGTSYDDSTDEEAHDVDNDAFQRLCPSLDDVHRLLRGDGGAEMEDDEEIEP